MRQSQAEQRVRRNKEVTVFSGSVLPTAAVHSILFVKTGRRFNVFGSIGQRWHFVEGVNNGRRS